MEGMGAPIVETKMDLCRASRIAILVSSLASFITFAPGCEGGGGTFVGQERPEQSGVTCDQCLPEIDPTPVDCEAAEAGIEFYPAPILSFDRCGAPMQDEDGNWNTGSCVADNMYAYSDSTTSYWTLTDTWKPAASVTRRCKGDDEDGVPTFALNLKGGPFTNWGGGIGRNLKCLNGSPYNGEVKVGDITSLGAITNLGCDPPDPLQACDSFSAVDEDGNLPMDEEAVLLRTACPERDQAVIGAADEADPIAAAPPEEEFMLGVTLDLTEWDGISFWARRSSNDVEPGIRIVLGDKHTSDDLSYLQYHVNPEDERHCERKIECGCQGNSPCYGKEVERPDPDRIGATILQTEYRCWDTPPRASEIPLLPNGEPDLSNPPPDAFLECGDSICLQDYEAFGMPDVQRAGTTCNDFTFRGGQIETLCYDPEDGPFPVERTDQCGDHWVHPVRLSTEWQLYKVPFTSLLQEGWAKESFKLDLTSAVVVRFTWSTGWHDFWVDDVRFYRNEHNTSGGDE